MPVLAFLEWTNFFWIDFLFEGKTELELLRDTVSLLVAYFLLPYSAQDIFSYVGFLERLLYCKCYSVLKPVVMDAHCQLF